jgi:GNAT superfamily N-acetyltransferase
VSAAAQLAELQEQVRIRPMEPMDARFIVGSWLDSYRKGDRASAWAARIPGPVYYPHQREVIGRCLERSTIRVACHVEDEGQILGWAAVERTRSAAILHYVYVKQVFRHLGVAHALLDELHVHDGFTSHLTEGGRALAADRRLLFNPYLAGVTP